MRIQWYLLLAFLCSSQLSAASAISFVKNEGQWNDPSMFRADFNSGTLFLEDHTLTFLYRDSEQLDAMHHQHCTEDEAHSDLVLDQHTIKILFEGANSNSKPVGRGKQKAYHNYFIGQNQDHWKSRVPLFDGVLYEEMYAGIDLLVYSVKGNLKYDFIVHPGADPAQIKMRIEGADNLCLKNEELYINTSVNQITELSPYSYLNEDGRPTVSNKFVLEDNQLSFQVGDYDTNSTLIIDPELLIATYSGSFATIWAHSATYGQNGDLYAGGRIYSASYPISTGAFQETFNDNTSIASDTDMIINKMSADGTTLLFATFIGGFNGGAEHPNSLIANNNDDLIILGYTTSDDYPITSNAYDTTFNGDSDLVLSILSSDGTSLLGSTFLGGSDLDGDNPYNVFYEDSYRAEVVFDPTDNSILGISSTNSDDFPVTPGAFQSFLNGASDAIVFKLSADLSDLIWSTYLGGSEVDAGFSVRFDRLGDVVVVGSTSSFNFPTTTGALQTTFMGGATFFPGTAIEINPPTDGFVTRLSADGSSVLNSTFIGTQEFDQCYFVDLDNFNNVYIYGITNGDFPISDDVVGAAGGHVFLAELKPSLSSFDWSTALGFANNQFPELAPTAFAVDICRGIYAGGFEIGFSSGNQTTYFPTTPDAIANSSAGLDYYFLVLEQDAESLSYGTYFGGNGDEHVDGGTSRYDKNGIVYQALCANSTNLPTSPGAFDPFLSPNRDMFVFKYDFERIWLEIEEEVQVDTPSLCIAQGSASVSNFFTPTLSFSDEALLFWDIDEDGTIESTDVTANLIFPDTGLHVIQLVVIDSSTCNVSDTTQYYINIQGNEEIEAAFSFELGDFCAFDYTASFTNSSILTGSTVSNNWDLTGNGVFDENNLDEFTYDFGAPGTYEVNLVVHDTLPCFYTDSLSQTIVIPEPTFVEASFESPASGCVPHEVQLSPENVQDGSSYTWIIDNETQTSQGAQTLDYTFSEIGTHNIKLIVSDDLSCNLIDSIEHNIEVYETPNASFTYDAPAFIYTIHNIQFTYAGDLAAPYLFQWDLGNGDTSSSAAFVYSFPEQGSFEVCLTVTDPETGCNDETCQILVIASPSYIEVPTAFSPNGDGFNDTFKVFSNKVELFHLRIYNRWGQLIFETMDTNEAWDGTVNGEQQNIDVYTVIVDVTLESTEPQTIGGNLTLIR